MVMIIGMDVVKDLVMVFYHGYDFGYGFDSGYDHGYGLWLSFMSILTYVSTH